MAADKSLLEETTGYIGIGALEMLGLLAMYDAGTKFYDLVRTYMDASALFAIPCLALAYLLGLSTAAAWSQVAERRSPLSPELLARLIEAKAEHLISRFVETERQSRLLGGSTVSLAVLAVGMLAEVSHAAQFKVVALSAACMFIVLSAACGVLARKLQHGTAGFIQRALPKSDA